MEALMFSIYSCSVNAMSDEECRSMLNEDKSSVFHRLIGATQHALMNANLLTSPDMMVLQAFVLFLVGDPRRLHYDFLTTFSSLFVSPMIHKLYGF